MPEALVTGANGFVGSHICEALLHAGFAVRALVRKTSDLTNLNGINVKLTYGDLSDRESLVAAVADVEFIVNNAGLVKANNPKHFHSINALGTENILLAALGHQSSIRRFIQISSTAACGPSPGNYAIDESHIPAPLTSYGRSKLEAEHIAQTYAAQLPVVILRPSAVYGPRDTEMYKLFRAVKLGIKPAFGCSQNYVNFTYVKDLARAVVSVFERDVKSGNLFFIAEKKSYSYSEAGDIIAALLGRRAHTLYVPQGVIALAGSVSERIARIRHKPTIFTRDKAVEIAAKYWLFDSSWAERELEFNGTEFTTGAAETVAWYKKMGRL